MCTICDYTNINTIIEFVPHVSDDGFNGGSDSYVQFRDTCRKRRNINLVLYSFISVINQFDEQNFCFTISLFHACTCSEHMFIIRRSKLHCTASGIITGVHETATYRCDDTRGCVMQFWPPDDEHMCSKHAEARNKLFVKQKFCASSWLITEINILRCTVSKTSKFDPLRNPTERNHMGLHLDCTVYDPDNHFE